MHCALGALQHTPAATQMLLRAAGSLRCTLARPPTSLLSGRRLGHSFCSMTRTKAQGRGQETGDAAAAGATAAAPAAAPAAPKTFSPALTTIDPSQYDAQLEAKVQRVTAQFAEFNPPPLTAYRSRPEHYRMRWAGREWGCSLPLRIGAELHQKMFGSSVWMAAGCNLSICRPWRRSCYREHARVWHSCWLQTDHLANSSVERCGGHP